MATPYTSTVYQGSNWNTPQRSSKIGLCLSGGGSRALSAGLGQLLGLHSIANGQGGTLLDSIDYISSVSGGTWLTSIFSFSPIQDLSQLLGSYIPPEQLDTNNIAELPPNSIGQVPTRMSYGDMLSVLHEQLSLEDLYQYPQIRKWAWAAIIGEQVLKPYGLYQGSIQGTGADKTLVPSKFFSLSAEYVQQSINSLGGNNSQLSRDDFYLLQPGRPFPIMNANIKLKADLADAPLLPMQATPIAAGATGTIRDQNSSISANGGVDSFAFTSSLVDSSTRQAQVNIERRYSLVDIVSCSSAFYAELVGKQIAAHAPSFKASADAIAGEIHAFIDLTEQHILDELASFVPQYNYWPAGVSHANNSLTAFADGGDLDNSGLIGMLSRTDANKLIVCINTSSGLGKAEDLTLPGYAKKVCIISNDVPVLFGFQPDPVNGCYVPFSDDTPQQYQYLRAAQVFEPSAFGPLLTALFAASQNNSQASTAMTQNLTVVDNDYAGIRNRGTVDVLWLYNNYAAQWVKNIAQNSEALSWEIHLGVDNPLSDYHNFPHYNTETQIHLNATQVNALAQFQAWVVHQSEVQIKQLFGV